MKKTSFALEWERIELKCGVHKIVTPLGKPKRVKLELKMKQMWHLIGQSGGTYLFIAH